MHARLILSLLALILVVAAFTPVAAAEPVSGAIFTTVADGTEVNYNIYSLKEDVYLDGGPGPGAPQSAAALPDGVYVFMVTDPSGKVLLSLDNARCRQFNVVNGIINDVNPAGTCAHLTGMDIDHGARTVQLMPYADTPNPGGVYKVWVTPIGNFPPNCLDSIDCATGKHGFTPRYSKTDNYKVRGMPFEIDTRFYVDLNRNGRVDSDEPWLDSMGVTWHDTLGASNKKWSYYNDALQIYHEAHIESPEVGTHLIDIANQAGCNVNAIAVDGPTLPKSGPQTVSVTVRKNMRQTTIFLYVGCLP